MDSWLSHKNVCAQPCGAVSYTAASCTRYHLPVVQLPALGTNRLNLLSWVIMLQTAMLEQHEKKKSEFGEWSGVVNNAVSQKDLAAKEAVLTFQKMKKKLIRSGQEY